MATPSSLESPLPRVPPARLVARELPVMEVKGTTDVFWSLAPASVTRHDDNPLRLPLSSSSLELSTSCHYFFAKRDMAHAAPMAFLQRAREPKVSRRPRGHVGSKQRSL